MKSVQPQTIMSRGHSGKESFPKTIGLPADRDLHVISGEITVRRNQIMLFKLA